PGQGHGAADKETDERHTDHDQAEREVDDEKQERESGDLPDPITYGGPCLTGGESVAEDGQAHDRGEQRGHAGGSGVGTQSADGHGGNGPPPEGEWGLGVEGSGALQGLIDERVVIREKGTRADRTDDARDGHHDEGHPDGGSRVVPDQAEGPVEDVTQSHRSKRYDPGVEWWGCVPRNRSTPVSPRR